MSHACRHPVFIYQGRFSSNTQSQTSQQLAVTVYVCVYFMSQVTMDKFTMVDYIVLVSVLLCSLFIGIFFARKKQDSGEYTSGKGKLRVLPVGLSQTASFISAITVQAGVLQIFLHCRIYNHWTNQKCAFLQHAFQGMRLEVNCRNMRYRACQLKCTCTVLSSCCLSCQHGAACSPLFHLYLCISAWISKVSFRLDFICQLGVSLYSCCNLSFAALHTCCEMVCTITWLSILNSMHGIL